VVLVSKFSGLKSHFSIRSCKFVNPGVAICCYHFMLNYFFIEMYVIVGCFQFLKVFKEGLFRSKIFIGVENRDMMTFFCVKNSIL
jgi:hypothetical protein